MSDPVAAVAAPVAAPIAAATGMNRTVVAWVVVGGAVLLTLWLIKRHKAASAPVASAAPQVTQGGAPSAPVPASA